MSKYKIHLGYVIENSKKNKESYIELKYNLREYNIELNSIYIDFKRGNFETDRSINFNVNATDILDIIQKIPRDYIFVYIINLEDNYKIIYDIEDRIRSKKLNEEELTIYNKVKEKVFKDQTEIRYIQVLESKIKDFEKEISEFKIHSDITKDVKTNTNELGMD